MLSETVVELLETYYHKYNQASFIEHDPISVPHQFKRQQDIELAGFFAAILAWGQRKSILKSCNRLMHLMDYSPYEFVLHHQPKDLKRFDGFVHRTFNSTDVLYCIYFFQHYYQQHHTLETAFLANNIEQALIQFQELFFSMAVISQRTKKHIASPKTKSTCKRLNMYLRWMVRKDNCGVDFGIWQQIAPKQLLMPLDVHVERYARQLNLIQRKQRDWLTVKELTTTLQLIDANDPVRFDFALFGMGLERFDYGT